MIKLGQEGGHKTATYQLIILTFKRHDSYASEVALKIKNYLISKECEKLPYIVCLTDFGQRNENVTAEGIN